MGRNNFWSIEEEEFLIEALEKKTNISYPYLQKKLYNISNKLRTFKSIQQRLTKMGLKLRNGYNKDLTVDYYHLSEFKKYGFGSNKRIKEILQNNGIKTYKRNTYQMIHCDDIEKAEEIIKTALKIDTVSLGKIYKSKLTLSKEYYINIKHLNDLIKAGVISPTFTQKKFSFFDKIQEEKLKRYLNEFDKKHYNASQIEGLLEVGKGNGIKICKRFGVKYQTIKNVAYVLKEDFKKVLEYKYFIFNDCYYLLEKLKEINISYVWARIIMDNNKMKIHKWKQKAYISKKDFDKLVTIITKNK